MAYSWDPGSGQFVWTPPGGGVAGVGGIMEDLAPFPTAREAWELAAQTAMPGYASRPGLASYMEGAMAPTYGQWLMSPQAALEPGLPATAFQDWLMDPQFVTPPAGQTGAYSMNPRWGPGSIAPPTTAPADWEDLVKIARALNPAYGTGPQDISGMAGYAKWQPTLTDPTGAQARALASMAMYDPAAGSIRGGMRASGRARRMEEYWATRPGMTAADWLGYITGQPGMTASAYQVA